MNYYNIHGLVKIHSTMIFPRIDYFKTPVPVEPDLIVDTEKKVEKTGDPCIIYCNDRYKVSRWRIKIENIETIPVRVSFNGDPFFSMGLLFSAIIEPLIKYILSLQNGTILHASSISLNDYGVAFCGRSGTGKTTALLNMFSLDSVMYYSDDQSIVKDGVLYSYPTPIGVRTNTLINTGLQVNLLDLLGILGQNIVNAATMYYGNLTWNLPVTRLKIKDRYIVAGDKVPLRQVYILNIGDKDRVQRLDQETAYNYLVEFNMNNNKKQGILDRYFNSYRIETGNDLWARTYTILEKYSRIADYYLITLKQPYKLQELVQTVQEVKS